MDDSITPRQLDTQLHTCATESERKWRQALSDMEQRLDGRIDRLYSWKTDRWETMLYCLMTGLVCMLIFVWMLALAGTSR
jgi:hypothetical protein